MARGFVGRRGCRGRVTRGVLSASSYITRVLHTPPPTRPLKTFPYHVLRLPSVNQGGPADSISDNKSHTLYNTRKCVTSDTTHTNPEKVTHDSYPYTLPRCAGHGHGTHLIGGRITAYRSGISRITRYHPAPDYAGESRIYREGVLLYRHCHRF